MDFGESSLSLANHLFEFYCHVALGFSFSSLSVLNWLVRMNQTDDWATKRIFAVQHCSLLQLLTYFLSLHGFTLIRCLAGSNTFLPGQRLSWQSFCDLVVIW